MRSYILGATLLVASHVALAQDPLSAARKSAQKAAAATNAHIAAEQRPDSAAKVETKAPAAKTAPAATKSAPSAPKSAQSVASKPESKTAAKPAPATPAPAPDSTNSPAVIYRESFVYAADGRRDPFNSLLTTNELRPTLSDLRLTGVLFDHSGSRSVATLRDIGTNALYRVTTGSTLGRMTVSNIRRTTVVFTIDEFGMKRQDSLILRDTTKARGK